jgi:hypothetical protein
MGVYILTNDSGMPTKKVITCDGKVKFGEQYLAYCLLSGEIFLCNNHNRQSTMGKRIKSIEEI